MGGERVGPSGSYVWSTNKYAAFCPVFSSSSSSHLAHNINNSQRVVPKESERFNAGYTPTRIMQFTSPHRDQPPNAMYCTTRNAQNTYRVYIPARSRYPPRGPHPQLHPSLLNGNGRSFSPGLRGPFSPFSWVLQSHHSTHSVRAITNARPHTEHTRPPAFRTSLACRSSRVTSGG
jgi:hypothetical protein